MGEVIKSAKQFIELTDRNAVRADSIVRVFILSDHLMVQTADGEAHETDTGYGQSIWQAKSQLLEKVEVALAAANKGA